MIVSLWLGMTPSCPPSSNDLLIHCSAETSYDAASSNSARENRGLFLVERVLSASSMGMLLLLLFMLLLLLLFMLLAEPLSRDPRRLDGKITHRIVTAVENRTRI